MLFTLIVLGSEEYFCFNDGCSCSVDKNHYYGVEKGL